MSAKNLAGTLCAVIIVLAFAPSLDHVLGPGAWLLIGGLFLAMLCTAFYEAGKEAGREERIADENRSK